MKFVTYISFALFTTSVYAAPMCEVVPEKKKMIESTLCGQESVDEAYQQSGSDCFKRSIEKRLEDSAIQIHILSICGEEELANSMQEATIKAMRFVEILAPCVSEDVNVQSIMEERTVFVRKKASGLSCDANMSNIISKRKPAFEAMIAQSKDINLVPSILEKLQISVDADGNVTDR